MTRATRTATTTAAASTTSPSTTASASTPAKPATTTRKRFLSNYLLKINRIFSLPAKKYNAGSRRIHRSFATLASRITRSSSNGSRRLYASLRRNMEALGSCKCTRLLKYFWASGTAVNPMTTWDITNAASFSGPPHPGLNS